MAIRFEHLLEGLRDPLKDQGRFWVLLGGIKRDRGAEERRWPFVVAMLRWSHWRYAISTFDEFIMYAAVVLAWFFGLRGGEYTASPGQLWQLDRVLTGNDVIPRAAGVRVRSFRQAGEVVINTRGSKGDQYNAGQICNRYPSTHTTRLNL